MGTLQVDLQVGDPSGRHFQPVGALGDTGSTFTWITRDVLHGLGLVPSARWQFEIAGGQVIEREVAETRVRYDGDACTTIAVFGDIGSRPTLGAYTLEGLRLAVDPVNRRLVRVRTLAL